MRNPVLAGLVPEVEPPDKKIKKAELPSEGKPGPSDKVAGENQAGISSLDNDLSPQQRMRLSHCRWSDSLP
jgi:hypothetical protein